MREFVFGLSNLIELASGATRFESSSEVWLGESCVWTCLFRDAFISWSLHAPHLSAVLTYWRPRPVWWPRPVQWPETCYRWWTFSSCSLCCPAYPHCFVRLCRYVVFDIRCSEISCDVITHVVMMYQDRCIIIFISLLRKCVIKCRLMKISMHNTVLIANRHWFW